MAQITLTSYLLCDVRFVLQPDVYDVVLRRGKLQPPSQTIKLMDEAQTDQMSQVWRPGQYQCVQSILPIMNMLHNPAECQSHVRIRALRRTHQRNIRILTKLEPGVIYVSRYFCMPGTKGSTTQQREESDRLNLWLTWSAVSSGAW